MKQEGISSTELRGSCRELGQNAPSTTRTTSKKVEANLPRQIASKGPTEKPTGIVAVTEANTCEPERQAGPARLRSTSGLLTRTVSCSLRPTDFVLRVYR